MAFQSIWYFTDLPEKIIDIIEEDVAQNFDHKMTDAGNAVADHADSGTNYMFSVVYRTA